MKIPELDRSYLTVEQVAERVYVHAKDGDISVCLADGLALVVGIRKTQIKHLYKCGIQGLTQHHR